jgi:hypothetical protein
MSINKLSGGLFSANQHGVNGISFQNSLRSKTPHSPGDEGGAGGRDGDDAIGVRLARV